MGKYSRKIEVVKGIWEAFSEAESVLVEEVNKEFSDERDNLEAALPDNFIVKSYCLKREYGGQYVMVLEVINKDTGNPVVHIDENRVPQPKKDKFKEIQERLGLPLRLDGGVGLYWKLLKREKVNNKTNKKI